MMTPAVDGDSGRLTVHLFDGTRQLVQAGTRFLMTAMDGAGKQVYRDYLPGPHVALNLAFTTTC